MGYFNGILAHWDLRTNRNGTLNQYLARQVLPKLALTHLQLPKLSINPIAT